MRISDLSSDVCSADAQFRQCRCGFRSAVLVAGFLPFEGSAADAVRALVSPATHSSSSGVAGARVVAGGCRNVDVAGGVAADIESGAGGYARFAVRPGV